MFYYKDILLKSKKLKLILIVSYFLGTFGLRKPWYFPFTTSYWKTLCGLVVRRQRALGSGIFSTENFDGKVCEDCFYWTQRLPSGQPWFLFSVLVEPL